MKRAAKLTNNGIFPAKCPRSKTRCYNGNGVFCNHMEARTNEDKAGNCFVLCSAPTTKGKKDK